PARRATRPAPRPRPRDPARRPRPSFLPDQAERLQRPAQGRGTAPDPGAVRQQVGVLGERRVVPLRHQGGQRRGLAAHRPRAPAARPRRAAPLLAGGLEPAGERPLANPVGPRDLGLAALAGLAGGEDPLAQAGGVGTRHRSPPVGVKATPTADRGAGSADTCAIGAYFKRTVTLQRHTTL